MQWNQSTQGYMHSRVHNS